MDEIQAMLDALEELRGAIDGFDLDVHNDEDNEAKIASIRASCDSIEGDLNDLVP